MQPENKTTAAVSVLCEASRAETRGAETIAAVRDWLATQAMSIESANVIDASAIALENAFRALNAGVDLWVVCGATGIGPEDIAPEVLLRLSDVVVPGVGEIIRAESLKLTPNAVVSRCGAYVSKGRVIVSIAGNSKAAVEQLEIVKRYLPKVITAARGRCESRSKG